MVVLTYRPLREFWAAHPAAEGPLRRWYAIANGADWASIQDVRAVFQSADAVPNEAGETLTVFNVGGNHFRLATRIVYRVRTIYVVAVMTHDEYDGGRWKRS